jgi:hypothetical protein
MGYLSPEFSRYLGSTRLGPRRDQYDPDPPVAAVWPRPMPLAHFTHTLNWANDSNDISVILD